MIKRRWLGAVPHLLIAAIFVGAFIALGELQGPPGPDDDVVLYLRTIQPLEKELVDVRKNLRAVALGASHEAVHKVAKDAEEHHEKLRSVQPVPKHYAEIHRDFVEWSQMLKTCAESAAKSNGRHDRGQIAQAIEDADELYRSIEMRVADDERR